MYEIWGFPDGLVVENPPASAGATGDAGSIRGWGRSSGEGNSNPLQYPCLENSMDGGAWRATVHEATKSWTQLSTHPQITYMWKTHLSYLQSEDCIHLRSVL